MEDAELKAVLEGLIFVSETPLTVDRMKEVVGAQKRDLQRLLSEMVEEYRVSSRGFLLAEVAEGFQFRTRPEHAEWVRKLKKGKAAALSQPALETLAIVAYRQPVLRTDIEKIRGVDSGGVLRTLLERKLVKIIGKKDVPGKPLVYGTSRRFLEVFGLKDLTELPTLKDLEGLGPPSADGILPLDGEGGGEEGGKKEEPKEAAADDSPSAAPEDSI